jgi:hypothetical protein
LSTVKIPRVPVMSSTPVTTKVVHVGRCVPDAQGADLLLDGIVVADVDAPDGVAGAGEAEDDPCESEDHRTCDGAEGEDGLACWSCRIHWSIAPSASAPDGAGIVPVSGSR